MGQLSRSWILAALLAASLSGCGEASLPAGPQRPPIPPPVSEPLDPGVFQGEVVALGCYLRQGAKGEAHRPCAEASLKKGMPAGLLKNGGEVLLLIPEVPGAGPDLSAFAAQRCEVHGKLLTRAGMWAVEVASISRLPPPAAPPTIPPPPPEKPK